VDSRDESDDGGFAICAIGCRCRPGSLFTETGKVRDDVWEHHFVASCNPVLEKSKSVLDITRRVNCIPALQVAIFKQVR